MENGIQIKSRTTGKGMAVIPAYIDQYDPMVVGIAIVVLAAVFFFLIAALYGNCVPVIPSM